MKKIYTTSEYVNALRKRTLGQLNCWECKGEFSLFPDKASAIRDAEWLVDYQRRCGKRVRKPKVYEIKLVEVKK